MDKSLNEIIDDIWNKIVFDHQTDKTIDFGIYERQN